MRLTKERIDVSVPINNISINRWVLLVKGQREDGLYDYEVVPMTEMMENAAQQILSDPARKFFKVRCGDSRMEDNSILLSCLLYNAKGPGHTFAGGVGVPSRLIAGLKSAMNEHASSLGDLEIVARSSWITFRKFKDIFDCTGTIYYEHSDCHGWKGIEFPGPEEEKDMHLQGAIILTKQKREVFDGIDQSFVVYGEFKGEELISVDIYHIFFV